jgi:hypothetical protein
MSASRRKLQAMQWMNIWPCSMTPRSAPRLRSFRSSSRRRIRRHAGPGAHGGQAFFAYSTNYLVDVENAIIVDVEATTAMDKLSAGGKVAKLKPETANLCARALGMRASSDRNSGPRLVDQPGAEDRDHALATSQARLRYWTG